MKLQLGLGYIVKLQTPLLSVRAHSRMGSARRAYEFAIWRGGNVLNLITVNTLVLLKRCPVCNRLHERIILRSEKVSWKKGVVEMKYIYIFLLPDFISTRKLALCIYLVYG